MAESDSIAARRAAKPRSATLDVAAVLVELEALTVRELWQRYAEVFNEAARSSNKRWLIRKIIWRLQANAEGDLSKRARRRAEELADDADVRVTPPRDFMSQTSTNGISTVRTNISIHTDPRIPSVGTSITREYKGQTLEVRVLASGFEYEGEKYTSLSAVAKAITGSHCNGFRFFNLEAK